MLHPWLCERCRTVLGHLRHNRIHLRLRNAEYTVDGPGQYVSAVCKSCGFINEWSWTQQRAGPRTNDGSTES